MTFLKIHLTWILLNNTCTCLITVSDIKQNVDILHVVTIHEHICTGHIIFLIHVCTMCI